MKTAARIPRKKRWRQGLLRNPQTCHYCPEPATTRDHIVPRSKMRPGVLPIHDVPSTVPACEPCNQRKRAKISTCPCERCAAARAAYGPIKSEAPGV